MSPTTKQTQQYRSLTLLLYGLSPTTKQTQQDRSMPLCYCMVCHQQQQYRSMPLYYCMVCHHQQSKHSNTDLCHCTTVWYVTNNKANTPIQIYATALLYGMSPTTKQTQQYRSMPLYYCMVCHQQHSKRQYRSMPLYYSMVCHQQQSKHNNTDQCHCTTVWFVTNNKVSTVININNKILPKRTNNCAICHCYVLCVCFVANLWCLC